MKKQGLNPRHIRLLDYLKNVCKLETEKVRFAETHGRAEGDVSITNFFLLSEASEDTVLTAFDWSHEQTETRIANDYVLHFVVQDFGGDLTLLISQLLYWMATEKQDIAIDYKWQWNNNQTIDVNFYLEIEERTKGTAEGELVTC